MASNVSSQRTADARMVSDSTHDTLLPFTRLVLLISGVVQIVFGIVGLFFIDLGNSLLWSPPLPAWPELLSRFNGISYLSTAAAALFALAQGKWSGARVYFAYSFPYILAGLVLIFITVATTGIPLIMWLYVLLSLIYLPMVAYAWISQSRRG
jgi:hypothetical protein